MRRLWAAGCALLLLAAAPMNQDWIASVLGTYGGPVLNGGRIQQLTTVFSLDEQGHLVGHYHVEDSRPFDGELTDFQPEAPMQGRFTWQDPFGTGVVVIRFDPEHGEFHGRWGDEAPLPQHVFDGYRRRAAPTS